MLPFPETEYYRVVVGYSEAIGRNVYQVVNKFTDIVEFEHPTYPVVYTQVEQLQYAVDSLAEADEDEGDEPPDNVTPFKPH